MAYRSAPMRMSTHCQIERLETMGRGLTFLLISLSFLFSATRATATVAVGIEASAFPTDDEVEISVTLSANDDEDVSAVHAYILLDTTDFRIGSVSDCAIESAIADDAAGCEETTPSKPCKTLGRRLLQCGSDPQQPGCPESADSQFQVFQGFVSSSKVLGGRPIVDGTTLFRCRVNIVAPRRLPLTISLGQSRVFDSSGRRTEIGESSAVVPIVPTPTPTLTPSHTLTPTPSSTPSITSTRTPSKTPTSTQTLTPTQTTTPSLTPTSTATAPRTATRTHTPTPTPPCPGDCDRSGEVEVDEIITLVIIALGTRDFEACTVGDVNGDRQITVDEILIALSKGLQGCATSTSNEISLSLEKLSANSLH